MAMNLADRIAVRAVIRDRCTAAAVHLALYIINEAGNADNHANRLLWAKQCMHSPAAFGDEVSWHVVDNATFLTSGSDISDEDLKNAVEAAINTFYITSA